MIGDLSSDRGDLQLACIGAEWQTEVAGGANRYTYGLAAALAELGLRQHWLVMGERVESEWSGCDITAVASPGDKLLKRLGSVRRAARLHAGNVGLVATHFALYAAPALSALRHVPHVHHFHGPWAAESAFEGASAPSVWAKRLLENRVYRRADRVITLSQAFADLVAEQYQVRPDRIRVVTGGIDPERWNPAASRDEARQELGWPTDRPIVFCVRRLARRMGLENLLEAVATLRTRHPDLLLVIGGGGPLREELEQRAAALDLAGMVRFAGFVPEMQLPLAYRAADFSIVPTECLEGFGLVVLESLAAGTPAVVTPVGGLPEVVEPLAPELVCEAATAKAMTERLDAVLAGRVVLPPCDACQQYAFDRFAWPNIARQVLDVYREVADG